MDKVKLFQDTTKLMEITYKAKNDDYGNSFSESIKKYGNIAAIVRMEDKFNRLNNLLLKGGSTKVKDESAMDTLLDLANYAIMLYMELKIEDDKRKF